MGRTVWWVLGLGMLLSSAPKLAADQGADSTLRAIPDTGHAGPRDVGRPRAIQHSDAFYTRLTIHRIGAYAILPVFAGEYFLGNHLLNGTNVPDWEKGAHSVGAWTIGAIFAANTVTGIWNFVEARNDEGKARRLVHLALMLASDAGFAYTASLAPGERRFLTGSAEGTRHRNAALVSIGLSTVGTVIMWVWKN